MKSTYDPGSIEDKWYQTWMDSGAFSPASPDSKSRSAETYSIVIPPPNVTGALHLGHALNNTLQDILIRWQRKTGKRSLWVPGTDHAGIATQAVVEKRLFEEEKKTRRDVGRKELVKRIWTWKDEYENTITSQLKKMGLSLDWSRQRFTLDEVCARAVNQTFFDLFKKGLIYRGKRLVNWDVHLQTAVADDEIFYETVQGHMWTFKYMLADGSGFLPVSTTRPETILGDTAVAVHPKDERYKKFIGKKLKVPFVNREIDVIEDGQLVDMEFGTGCVKVTPAHDPNDYATGIRHKLEMINILTEDGYINENGGPFKGMDLKESRLKIIADLENDGMLINTEDHEHQVGHSDRSKTAIEPYLSDQWFVAMADLAENAIQAVKKGEVKFHPRRYENSYLDWLGEKRDWCISRQLWWGHQIPIWYCSTCTEDDLKTAYGKDDSFTWIKSGERWLICSRTGKLDVKAMDSQHTLKQDPDVLDTWFSSALWPHSTLGWPEKTDDLKDFYPTSTLVTSRDIISLWVARMVMTGQENMKKVPFSDVYIHSTILDGKGQRMSKSKGNGVDPRDIIEKYGADALRYTLASMATDNQDARLPVTQEKLKDGRTINVSEKFELGRNFANKLWNAARFVLPHYNFVINDMNVEGIPEDLFYDLDDHKTIGNLTLTNQWIFYKLQQMVNNVTSSLESYRFGDACAYIYQFTWDDFCSTYLEMQKQSISGGNYALDDVITIRVFMTVLKDVLNVLNPIMPFLTEEIWSQISEKQFLINDRWPVYKKALTEPEGVGSMQRVFAIKDEIRSIRGSYSIPRSKDLKVQLNLNSGVSFTDTDKGLLKQIEPKVEVSISENQKKVPFSASFLFKGGQGYVSLEGILDKEKEKKKMETELGRARGFMSGIEKKLANTKFVENAPEAVITREKEKLQDQKEKISKLESSLAEMA